MRRRTIGEAIGEDLKGPPDKEQASGEPKPQKTRVTFLLANEVMDRVRNCVYWTPGLTLSALMEQAIAEAVEKREKIGNVGRQGKLRKPKRGDQTTIGGKKVK
jgi:hypothetical protein